jgi:hypothetical protein
MISKLGVRMMKSLPVKILLEALVILVCMLEKVPSVTACPYQEDNSNACVDKDEDTLKIWKTGE